MSAVRRNASASRRVRCPGAPAHRLGLACVGVLAAFVPPAIAQSTSASGQGRTTALSASVEGSLNYIDTRRTKGEDKDDLAAVLRPRFNLVHRSGRVRGDLSYAAGLVQHSNAADSSEVQHTLDARLNAELVPNWAFFDADASVSRRAISAFGEQSAPGSVRENANSEQVAQLSVRPSVRGMLGDWALYDARLFASAIHTRSAAERDSSERGGSLGLNTSGGGLFGWGLNGSRQYAEFRGGRGTVNDRVLANVSMRPDPDLTLTARGGQERTNIADIDKRSYNNWGLGARWTPTERTLASVDADHRFFGKSWSVVLEHRFPRSSLRLTSARDISNGGSAGGVSRPVTLFQLYFNVYASIIPDPLLRAEFVRAMLVASGIDPDAIAPGGFLDAAASVQRRTDLAWVYTGLRITLSLQAFAVQSQVTDPTATQTRVAEGTVDQRGYNATATYRLTPTASATLGGSYLTTRDTAARPGNDLKSVSLGLSEKLGPGTTVSLTALHSLSNGGNPYRDTSLGMSLSHRF